MISTTKGQVIYLIGTKFCQHNFNNNVGHKDWVVCSFYRQARVYFKHENSFQVLMFTIFYPKRNINAECLVLLDKPPISDIADRHFNFILLMQLVLQKTCLMQTSFTEKNKQAGINSFSFETVCAKLQINVNFNF